MEREIVAGISVIVPGSLNTDLIGSEVERIPGPGELTTGRAFIIGPGGKSRNIAQMAAGLLGSGCVAMLGRTVRDSYGLWKPPFYALKKAGVNTSYIRFSRKGFPGIALIPVDKKGRNQIYVLPGASSGFSAADVQAAGKIFKKARVMAMSLELPVKTAIAAIKKSNKNRLKVILDPGGINEKADNSWILRQDIFMLKPNEHEARILTGIKITGFKSAARAANKLLKRKIANVLITAGKNGAYFFNSGIKEHLLPPKIEGGKVFDETGCGDQVTAVLAASTAKGDDILCACRLAVLAGTMQFYRKGIQPVTAKELKKYDIRKGKNNAY